MQEANFLTKKHSQLINDHSKSIVVKTNHRKCISDK